MFFQKDAVFDASIIDEMNAAIAHRGPDDTGKWLSDSGQVCLGHQRLSILDLSDAAHQPMISSKSSLVFNGEIYNYKDLINKNSLRGLESSGDTSVLLGMLDSKGVKSITELNGMFAFAYWDCANHQLILARDHLGIKPLYYYKNDKFIAFSSEVNALLKIPQVEDDIDFSSVQNYFQSNRQSGDATVYKGIRKVSPGSYMTVDLSGCVETHRYWNVQKRLDDSCKDEQFYTSALQDQLAISVRDQMVSDVPVGAFLSGGVDSSAVVALMRESSDTAISTFSIGFEGAESYDERMYAEQVARQFDTEHHLKVVTKCDVIEMLPKMVDIFDDPLSDPTSIPIYFLCEAAKENQTKVILTGDGADEIFFGYQNWMKYRSISPYFNFLKKYSAFAKLLGFLCQSIDLRHELLREMLYRAKEKLPVFLPGSGGMKKHQSDMLLSDKVLGCKDRKSENVLAMYDRYQKGGFDVNSVEDWMCYAGIADIHPNYFLYRADKLSSFHSIEIRVPFLDHRLVDLAFSIPEVLKVKNNVPKYILKSAMEKYLPQEVLYRKKMGFCVPVDAWVKDIVAREILESIDAANQIVKVFEPSAVKDLVRKSQSSASGGSYLWNVYFLMKWIVAWKS